METDKTTAHTSLLLVEGKSEKNLLPELCNKCGIECNFEIRDSKSLEQLKCEMKIFLKSSNIYRKLWVIIDADNNASAAWESIKYILHNSRKYQIPAKMPLPAEGAIITPTDSEDLTVGIWIMPDNSDIGMLEDFMLRLIPEDDSLLKEATTITDRLDAERESHHKIFKAVHKSKARIHTWLAWHDTPGESLTVAVKKRLFDTDKELCCRLGNWLNQLNS